MKKSFLYLFLAGGSILAIILIYIFINTKQKSDNENQNTILFYGDTCPHCAKVEEYIAENNTKDKIGLAEKEVYKNTDNAKILNEKAKKCDIKENEIGVPFLWADEKCYMGDEDIINYFKNKTNENQ